MPTVTAMIFTENGNICSDRIYNRNGAGIGIYAAGLKGQFSEELHSLYCDYEDVDNLQVEYAPFNASHAYSGWTALEVNANPDYDDTPGWGKYYEASLRNLPASTSDTWYALRITMMEMPIIHKSYHRHLW